MAENGNGRNGRYTAQQFIDAIPGTGGVISAIADRVGCAWHTARKYIDDYATVNLAWQNERNAITDRAQHNIIKSIREGDLAMSKWWLQVMSPEFRERQELEIHVRDVDAAIERELAKLATNRQAADAGAAEGCQCCHS